MDQLKASLRMLRSMVKQECKCGLADKLGPDETDIETGFLIMFDGKHTVLLRRILARYS